MKTLFTSIEFEGIVIFTDKSNWKLVLNFLKDNFGSSHFFFYFGSERGSHLKVFAEKISEVQFNEIQTFLKTIPSFAETSPQDPLFSNAPQNCVFRFSNIQSQADFLINNTEFYPFIYQLSTTIIAALNYNDFFIEEKNRINLATQLTFISLIDADKNLIMSELNQQFKNQSIKVQPQLVSFYKELQTIKQEEDTQEWVLNWIDYTADFLKSNSFALLVESITQILEIRDYSEVLARISYGVLNSVGVKI